MPPHHPRWRCVRERRLGEWRWGAARMSSATMPKGPSGTNPLDSQQSGLAFAVADVGWFNTENLFREIDRVSVEVLLLKCVDWVNGWRKAYYPWSRDCRLRRSSDT